MNRLQYRSPGLAGGAFNQLGMIHAHVDGGKFLEQMMVLGVVKTLEAKGFPGTLDYVLGSVVGPQRETEPETYEAHTPVVGDEEVFDFFSSHKINTRQDAILALGYLSELLSGGPGVIVEVEQNVGWLDSAGWQNVPLSDQVEVIHPDEVNVKPKPTMRYEIHHGIELPKVNAQLDMTKLARFCQQNGMVFGGWFVFDDGENWSYWSNAFTNKTNMKEQVETEQLIIQQFLESEGLSTRQFTLIERVLGIWHM